MRSYTSLHGVENVGIVFQMLRLGEMPEKLRNILVDRSILKIGHDLNRSDIHKLRNDYHIEMGASKDLLHLAKQRGFEKCSLAILCAAVLGLFLNKRATLSDWSSHDLSQNQISYAATDAWVTRKIFNTLSLPDEQFEQAILDNTGSFYDDSIRCYCCGACEAVFSDSLECVTHTAEENHTC